MFKGFNSNKTFFNNNNPLNNSSKLKQTKLNKSKQMHKLRERRLNRQFLKAHTNKESFKNILVYSQKIMENDQLVKVIEVKIINQSELKKLLQNLDFVNVIHPSLLTVLGFDCEDCISYFSVKFIFDNYIDSYINLEKEIYKDIKTSPKATLLKKLSAIYKIFMGYIALKISKKSSYILNSQNIVVDKNYEPKIVVPFFSKNFRDYQSYFHDILHERYSTEKEKC